MTSSRSVGQKSDFSMAGLSLLRYPVRIKMPAGLSSHLEGGRGQFQSYYCQEFSSLQLLDPSPYFLDVTCIGDPSQVPEAILIPCHVAPSISKTTNGTLFHNKSFSSFRSLTDRSLTSRSDLNGSCDLVGPTRNDLSVF